MLHRSVGLKDAHDLGDRGLLLADGHVDADEVLALLVDDRVDRDGGFARLAIADDEFPLAAANRNQGVDAGQSGLDRRVYRLPCDHAGGNAFHRTGARGIDRPLAIDGLADGVDYAAQQGISHRHGGNAAGALDQVALLDVGVLAHDDDADPVGIQVEHHAQRAVAGEFHQFHGHRLLEPLDDGNAVAHGLHLAHVDAGRRRLKGQNALLQALRQISVHHSHCGLVPCWRSLVRSSVEEPGAGPTGGWVAVAPAIPMPSHRRAGPAGCWRRKGRSTGPPPGCAGRPSRRDPR